MINFSNKCMYSITLFLSLVSHALYTQDIKPTSNQTDVATQVKNSAPTTSEMTKKNTAKSDTKSETKKAAPQKEEPKAPIKTTTEEKKVDVKSTPTAAAKKSAALWTNIEKLQMELMALISEAEAYTAANPADKEKVLEQFGIIFGMSIGALEKISGEKILEALEAPEAPSKKETKQPKRHATK